MQEQTIPWADRPQPRAEHARAAEPRVAIPGFTGNRDIFFAAVALTRVPMLISDPNLPDNPIAFANQAFGALTGYGPGELVGRNCRFLQGRDTDRRTVDLIREAVRRRTDIAVELLNYRRDGTAFWNALFISPVFAADGTLIYFFASQLDVTRRRDAERALAHSQRLEGLGALAGGMAHEFNNLLTVIRGNLEPLLQQTQEGRTAVRLSRVREAAERAAVLTRAMVAFARRQRLEDQTFDLGALLRARAAELARALAPACRLHLELPAEPVSIRADPEQFSVALTNLVLNARDAGPADGVVRIAVTLRRTGGSRPDVEVSVIDTGAGMTPEVAARAMDPFFTTKPPGAGVGLGLSMAYGFLRQSGGRLELSSHPGAGTAVRMVFPARPALPRLLPRAIAGEVILIVDDDADLRSLGGAMLEDLGYTVRESASADEAVRCVAAEARIDLVIADTARPGMNGAAFAARLRGLRPGIAVLRTSGLPAAGADGVLAKPFRAHELATRVRARLDAGRRGNPG